MANKIKPYDEYEDIYKDVYEEATPEQRARNYAKNAMGQAGSFNLPAPTPPKGVNVNGIPVQREPNYTQEGINDAESGNVVGSMFKEKMHNAKDGYYGLGYGASGIFNYIDPKGYSGLLEGKRKEIQDYFNQGFNYNYEDDPEYQVIRKLKEKEADKAYKDGYAQMSRAFDGDIPVNMINKLLATKSDIEDQADNYIPQLRQLAYNMHMDKGNALYNQYNMLGAEAEDDYNRWLTDRNYITSGIESNWNRNYMLERDAAEDAAKSAELERLYLKDMYERAVKDEERALKAEDTAFERWLKKEELKIKRQNANANSTRAKNSGKNSSLNIDQKTLDELFG